MTGELKQANDLLDLVGQSSNQELLHGQTQRQRVAAVIFVTVQGARGKFGRIDGAKYEQVNLYRRYKRGRQILDLFQMLHELISMRSVCELFLAWINVFGHFC